MTRLTTRATQAALALAITFGLSPKPTALAQFHIGSGATVTIAADAVLTDQTARTRIVGGGTLAVLSEGRLDTERFDVATGGVARVQGLVAAAGAVNVSGTIRTTIAGLSPEIDYGRIKAGGRIDLAGTLEVALAPGYNPADPTTFTLLSGGSLTRAFTTVSLPGAGWSESYTPTSALVTFATAPLPVTWLDFAAVALGRDVRLDWRTGSETGSDYFGVERLVDADFDRWRELGQVTAAGHSTQASAYNYLDADPGAGTHYYRLRQVDLDGAHDYSDVVSVAIAEATAMAVYPNPLSGGQVAQLTLAGFGEPAGSPRQSGSTAEEGALELEVHDAGGRLVMRRGIRAASTQPLVLPAGLATGVYQVTVRGASGARGVARVVVE